MRQPGKNNRQRGRGRRNGNGQINRNTTLDSNGPDVRLRGNALQLHEKYVSLGNDASAAGERISAEAYFQYADHYFRIHSAIIASSEERRKDGAEPNANGHAQYRSDARSMNGPENDDDNSDENGPENSAEKSASNGAGNGEESSTEPAVEKARPKSPRRVKAAPAEKDADDEASEAETAS